MNTHHRGLETHAWTEWLTQRTLLTRGQNNKTQQKQRK